MITKEQIIGLLWLIGTFGTIFLLFVALAWVSKNKKSFSINNIKTDMARYKWILALLLIIAAFELSVYVVCARIFKNRIRLPDSYYPNLWRWEYNESLMITMHIIAAILILLFVAFLVIRKSK